MSTELKLRVVTPAGPVVELMTTSITACSDVGEFCILPEHRPILASLKPGRFMFDSDGVTHIYVTDVGFFEGGIDHANVMTQHCVSMESVLAKVDALQNNLRELKQSLLKLEQDSPARGAIESSMRWIEAQLSVVQ